MQIHKDLQTNLAPKKYENHLRVVPHYAVMNNAFVFWDISIPYHYDLVGSTLQHFPNNPARSGSQCHLMNKKRILELDCMLQQKVREHRTLTPNILMNTVYHTECLLLI